MNYNYPNLPVGINGTQTLIENHLGLNGFNVVHDVQRHIHLLADIHKMLPLLRDFNLSQDDLTKLSSHLDKIIKVANSVDKLNYLADNVSWIEDFVPKIQELGNYMASVQVTLTKFDLDGLLAEHEKILNSLETVKSELNQKEKQLADLNDLSKRLTHLEASDAVDLALHTGSTEHKAVAYKFIEKSECAGNDESINRIKLGGK